MLWLSRKTTQFEEHLSQNLTIIQNVYYLVQKPHKTVKAMS